MLRPGNQCHAPQPAEIRIFGAGLVDRLMDQPWPWHCLPWRPSRSRLLLSRACVGGAEPPPAEGLQPGCGPDPV
ncbi:MAG: hypothetical protein ACK53Y_14660, partial [bacterium]